MPMEHFYRPQRKFAKVMFLQVSVCPRGGGMHGCWGGHVWFGGACMVARGPVWLLGSVCGEGGGMPDEGGVVEGACMAKEGMCGEGGACVGYDNIWRYDQ